MISVFDSFLEVVETFPSSIAIVDNEVSVTYAGLRCEIFVIRNYLSTLKVGLEDVCCLGLRGSFLPRLIFSIWELRAAFVTLDWGWPVERIEHVLRETQPKVIFLLEKDKERAGIAASMGLRLVCIDSEWKTLLEQDSFVSPPSVPVVVPFFPDSLAYIIYTSGSTGKPKGVAVTQAGLVSLVQAQAKLFQCDTSTRFLQLYSPTFDAFLSELLVALVGSRGGCAVWDDRVTASGLSSESLTLFSALSITHVCLPPALVSVIPDSAIPSCLKCVVVGGETTSEQAARAWSQKLLLINAYGPTECTVCATGADVSRDGVPPTIGRPFDSIEAYVVDSSGELIDPQQQEGTEGELCLSGNCVARGYYLDPVLTATRFTPCPWRTDGKRMYRTGDRAMWRNNQLVFLGRNDNQVQVRGARIETIEVETVLSRHPLISQAGVIPYRQHDTTELCAFVTPTRLSQSLELSTTVHPQRVALTVADVREYCVAHLPHTMVPRKIEICDSMPLLLSGKVDRQTLASRLPTVDTPSAQTAPMLPASLSVDNSSLPVMQSALCNLIQSLILTDSAVCTPDTDLSALGLSSLDAIRLSVECDKLHYWNIPPHYFLQYRTVSELCVAWERRSQMAADIAFESSSFGMFEVAKYLQDAVFTPLSTPPTSPIWLSFILIDSDLRVYRALSGGLSSPPYNQGGLILMTGATGWLGGYILSRVIKKCENLAVMCLVRDENLNKGKGRLLDILSDQLCCHALERSVGRLYVMRGDICQTRWGICDEDWELIKENCRAVIHSAGDVSYVKSYHQLKTANVDSLRTALDISVLCNDCPVHYISSLAPLVCSETPFSLIDSYSTISSSGRIRGSYALSKWIGDCLAQNALAAGVNVYIHRPAMLSVDSDGHIAPNDYLNEIIGACLSAASVPDLACSTDITPIDWVGKQIMTVIKTSLATEEALRQKQRQQRIIHYANQTSVSMVELSKRLNLTRSPISIWKKQLRQSASVFLQSLSVLTDSQLTDILTKMLFPVESVRFAEDSFVGVPSQSAVELLNLIVLNRDSQ